MLSVTTQDNNMPRLSIDEALNKTPETTAQPREGFDVAKFRESLQKNTVELPAMTRQADKNIGTGFDPTFERQEGEGFVRSGLKTLGNIPKSAYQLGKDVFSAVTNPVQTATAVKDLIAGTAAQGTAAVIENTEIGQSFAQKIDESRLSRGLPPLERRSGKIILPDTDEMKTAAAVGNYFSERYGSTENFKESVVEDPVGVLSDIASVVSGAGFAAKQTGNVSRVSRMSDAGTTLSRAGDMLEPTTAISRGATTLWRGVANTLPGRIIGEAAPTPGRFAEGEIVKALDLTQGDVRKISENTGNDVADFVARNSLLKETPEEIAAALGDFKNKQYGLVRSEVKAVPDIYAKTDVPRVNDALAAVQKVVDDVPGLEEVAAEVNRLAKQDSYSLEDIQRVKEILDANTNIYTRSGNIRDASTAQGLANVRAELRAFIEDEVMKATDGQTNIQKLNNDVATSRELMDAIEIRETRDLTRNYSPLTSTLLGGAAFAGTGDIYTALGVAAATKLIQTPSFRIALARTLKATPAKDLARWSREVAENKLSPQTRQALLRVIEEAKKNAEFIEAGSQVIQEANEASISTQ